MTPRTRLLIPLAVLALLAAACGSGSDATVATDTNAPGDDTTELEEPAADPPAEPVAAGVVEVTGANLAPFEPNDAAVGQPAPEVSSVDFSGAPVSITADGRPKVIVFVAHWCPHCQDEVPRLTDWLDEGQKPDGVDFVTIATAIDDTASNYPPSAWLDDEGLDTPTLVDDAGNTLANAYGLTGFPFWVVIDADGNVVARASGGLGAEGFASLSAAALASAPA